MSLRIKAFLFVVVAVGALVLGINLSTKLVVLNGFDEADRDAMHDRVDAARKVVATMVREFSERGNDWADWTDMATYVADGNQAFYDANVDIDSFGSIGWDVVMVVRADGLERVAVMRDRATGKAVPVPPAFRVHLPALMAGAAHGAPPVVGLAMVGDLPFLVSSRPIRQTDKSAGPVAGRFVTARLLDDAWRQRLEAFTFLHITFAPLAAPARDLDVGARAELANGADIVVHPVDDDHLAGWARLADFAQQPMLVMRVDGGRELMAHGASVNRSATVGVVVGGLLLILVSLLLLGRVVLRPLRRLLDGVRAVRAGERATVTVRSRDELGRLAVAFNEMAQAITDREAALRDANARTRLILDSTGDALLTCDLDGALGPDPSASAVAWFGAPVASTAAYLFTDDVTRATFELGLGQIADDLLPLELLVEQLPRRFTRADRTFAITYRPIEGTPRRLLLIISDITAAVTAEASARRAREIQALVGHLLRDSEDFARFRAEGGQLLDALAAPGPADDQRRRDLHTLKGNAAVMGMERMAEACHRLEDRLVDDPAAADGPAIAALRAVWDETLASVSAFAPQDDAGRIQISADEHRRFATLVGQHATHDVLAQHVSAWSLQPCERVLDRLRGQVSRLAAQLGKRAELHIAAHEIRVGSHQTAEFWSSLVHLIRNAIDHGVEPPDDRLAAGKSPIATIDCQVEIHRGELIVTVADDGRGIAWDRVRDRAAALGLPTGSERELTAALFHDGLSTRDEATAVSGRGVGLAAVRQASLRLGGECAVVSHPGRGTRFTFRFPIQSDGVALGVPAWTPARTQPIALIQ